ncbi:MAG: MobF family relaxase [Acidiferrobacteraceae bacterium]
MISIKHLKTSERTAAGVADYCQHTKDSEKSAGYYQSQSAPSEWLGRGAHELGLHGPVEREAFIRLLDGKLPDGTDISTRGHREGDRRMGTDLTISAPKSYSLMALSGDDDRFMDWWSEAVRVGASVIEDRAITARRGAGGVQVEHTGKMVSAVFTHEDTRTVAGKAAPDLHGHLIAVNMTQRSDGEWTAMSLDLGERNITRMIADFATKADLAQRLITNGYQVRRTADGFELDGVTRAQIEHFSPRKNQIDEDLTKSGLTRAGSTSAQREAANLRTRGSKTTLSQDEQRWEWRQEMREMGVRTADLAHQARERVAAGLNVFTDLSADAVKSAVRHLSERETIFSHDQVTLAALRAGICNTHLAGVTREIEAARESGMLIDLGGGKLTTREALLAEHAILESARAGRGQAQPLMTPAAVEKFISTREQAQGFVFTPGQRAALSLSLTSSDQTLAIEGAAGVGKTTAMKPIVAAYRAAGYEVTGLAPIVQAARQLRSAGADDTRTMQSFLLADVADPAKPRLVILDEAGRVSRAEMDRLQQKLTQMPGARVLFTGDYRQIGSVEAGSPFQQMIESGAIQSVRITEVQRQINPRMREMAQAWADRDVQKAMTIAREFMHEVGVPTEHRNKRGELQPTAHETRAALAAAAASNYLARDPEGRQNTLLMCGLNEVRRSANEIIRAGLQERGDIARKEIKIQALDKLDLSKEHRTLAERFEPGMVVRLDQGRGKTRTVTDYAVVRTEGERVILRDDTGHERAWSPHQADVKRMGVYQQREMALAVGDEIQIRANVGNRHRDPENALSNGQVGKVVELSEQGPRVEMDDGRTVILDKAARHCVDYSYCRTVAKTQGAEKTEVLLVGEAARVSSAQLAYVGLTRGIHDLEVITDHKDRLAAAWQKTADRQCAIEAARDQHRPDLAQLQELRVEAAAEIGHHGDLSRAREESRGREAGEAPAKAPARSGAERDDGLELTR